MAATAWMPKKIPMLINGAWKDGSVTRDIIDPYRGEVVAHAPESDRGDLDAALDAATSARDVMAQMPGYKRAEILRGVGGVCLKSALIVSPKSCRARPARRKGRNLTVRRHNFAFGG